MAAAITASVVSANAFWGDDSNYNGYNNMNGNFDGRNNYTNQQNAYYAPRPMPMPAPVAPVAPAAK